MADQTPELTPEAAAAGQDPAATSDPPFEAVKAGIVDAPAGPGPVTP